MNYTKPEVAVLGTAVRVIENHVTKPVTAIADALQNNKRTLAPAYDLD